MTQSGTWSPYSGIGSIILAVILLIATLVLTYCAARLHHPIAVKRPGRPIGVLIIAIWVLSVATFLLASTAYVYALYLQQGHLTAPANPITPVTATSGVIAFFVIVYLAQRSGFWVALGSALVGAIAAPMIFELPFDLIVMWHTYPPTPSGLYVPLFFLPLFLVAISSFAMLLLSPLTRLSRYSLYLLAAMFLIFAVWAFFGFAYPLAPLPIAFNAISKILAFAAAVSLFLPDGNLANLAHVAQESAATPAQAPYSSGLV